MSGLIILPSIKSPTSDPDKLAEQGVVAMAPICQRCSREHTFENPIWATQRKVWNPYDPDRLSRQFDIICSRCREEMRR